MSSRPQIKPHSVITNGSMAGNLTSTVSILDNLSMCSYSYSWAGTSPVGVITVEVSDDYSINEDGSVRNSGTWNALPSVTGAVAGNTGKGYVDVLATSAYAIRTVYTRASGTGTLQAKIVAKVG